MKKSFIAKTACAALILALAGTSAFAKSAKVKKANGKTETVTESSDKKAPEKKGDELTGTITVKGDKYTIKTSDGTYTLSVMDASKRPEPPKGEAKDGKGDRPEPPKGEAKDGDRPEPPAKPEGEAKDGDRPEPPAKPEGEAKDGDRPEPPAKPEGEAKDGKGDRPEPPKMVTKDDLKSYNGKTVTVMGRVDSKKKTMEVMGIKD